MLWMNGQPGAVIRLASGRPEEVVAAQHDRDDRRVGRAPGCR